MKKTLLTTTVLILALTATAQNDRSKKVDTKYLSLPGYDVSAIDPSTISIEFAMKSPSFGTERLKEGESVCKPAGGTVKDAVKVKSYYMEVPYTTPESYVVARSGDGQVVYANKTSESGQSSLKFGWDEKMKQALCEYALVSDKVKKDFAKQGESFKSSEHRKYESDVFKKASQEATANVSLSYMPETFEVFSAKGKTYDYTALDEAHEKAMNAYESIGKNGFNTNDLNALKDAIAVWEKELGSLDLEDKKARITKDIGKGLYENLAHAYFYLYDFENAKKNAEAMKELFGNFSNNRTQDMDQLLLRMHLQKIAAEKNASIVGDVSALHGLASKGTNPQAKMLTSADAENLQSDFYKFKGSQAMGLMEEKKKEEEALIASGELNPYQKYYYETMAGGEGIMMNLPPSAFSGIPEITAFPVEICEFTSAKQVIILKNQIATIPEEIAKLENLEKLDLSGNQLTSIPAILGSLKNLETLKLNDNPIESFANELGNCTNLKNLQIKGTKLSASQVEELQRLLPDCKIKL